MKAKVVSDLTLKSQVGELLKLELAHTDAPAQVLRRYAQHLRETADVIDQAATACLAT